MNKEINPSRSKGVCIKKFVPEKKTGTGIQQTKFLLFYVKNIGEKEHYCCEWCPNILIKQRIKYKQTKKIVRIGNAEQERKN